MENLRFLDVAVLITFILSIFFWIVWIIEPEDKEEIDRIFNCYMNE